MQPVRDLSKSQSCHRHLDLTLPRSPKHTTRFASHQDAVGSAPASCAIVNAPSIADPAPPPSPSPAPRATSPSADAPLVASTAAAAPEDADVGCLPCPPDAAFPGRRRTWRPPQPLLEDAARLDPPQTPTPHIVVTTHGRPMPASSAPYAHLPRFYQKMEYTSFKNWLFTLSIIWYSAFSV